MFPYRQAVSAEELEFGLGVTAAAAAQRGPYRNPESFPGLELGDGSGEVMKIKDTALARSTIAVMDQFGPQKGGAICYRIMALMDMLQEAEMQPYRRAVPGEPGALEFRHEVIVVAAGHPFDARGAFDKAAFVAAVKQAVRE